MRHPRVSEDSTDYKYQIEFLSNENVWIHNFEHENYDVAYKQAGRLHNTYFVPVRIVQVAESITDIFEQDSTE